jgi:hypothetical protein
MIVWLDGAMFLLGLVCALAFKDFPARCYLTVLALSQPFFAWAYGTEEYPIIYYSFTGILLLLGLWVALDVLERSLTRGLTLAAAVLIAGSAFYFARREIHSFDDLATIVEETLLAGYAIVVGLSATSTKQPMLYGSLALAWLLQAGFGFGYALHIGSRNWYIANGFFPAFINIALFAWMVFYATRPGASAKASPTPARICR